LLAAGVRSNDVGNEGAWWQDAGIDPIMAARKLWNDTRVNEGRRRPDQPEIVSGATPSVGQHSAGRSRGALQPAMAA
jgi:hypothetical protein